MVDNFRTLEVHAPLGDFILDESSDPIVLLSGGSGITAVLSMLESLATHGETREATFIHATRSRAHHAFGAHVRSLVDSRVGLSATILYESTTNDDIAKIHHDETGLISAERLRRLVPNWNAHFYYCGPVGFVTAVESALDALEIPPFRRHSEAFGPDPSFLREEITVAA